MLLVTAEHSGAHPGPDPSHNTPCFITCPCSWGAKWAVVSCLGLRHGSAGDFSVHGVLTGTVTPAGIALSPAHTALWPHALHVEQVLWGLWGDCHATVGSATHGSGLSFTSWCWQPRELHQVEPRSWGMWVPAGWALGTPQPMPQLNRASSPWEGEGSTGREG